MKEIEENGVEYKVVCEHGVHFGGFNCFVCHPEKMQSTDWLFRPTQHAADASKASDLKVTSPSQKTSEAQ